MKRQVIEYEIQQRTILGWETVSEAETKDEALHTLREYVDNQPEFPARIRRRWVTVEVDSGGH